MLSDTLSHLSFHILRKKVGDSLFVTTSQIENVKYREVTYIHMRIRVQRQIYTLISFRVALDVTFSGTSCINAETPPGEEVAAPWVPAVSVIGQWLGKAVGRVWFDPELCHLLTLRNGNFCGPWFSPPSSGNNYSPWSQ